MARQHLAQAGDSVESIAYDNGLFWETVWKAPENATLRATRDDPNILGEGDKVFVPDKRPKTEQGKTDRRHTFRRRGVPSLLQVRLLDQGKPRAGVKWKVVIGEKQYTGATDGDGWVICHVMPDATEGVQEVGGDGEVYEFEIGTVRPSGSLLGLQTRMRNLGWYDGAIDGELNPDFVQALKLFQMNFKLDVTGVPDSQTKAKLLDGHLS